jgi:hypothetical protein
MVRALHVSATTTEAAIQHRQQSLRALSSRYGINQKAVAKEKKRSNVAEMSDMCSIKLFSKGVGF